MKQNKAKLTLSKLQEKINKEYSYLLKGGVNTLSFKFQSFTREQTKELIWLDEKDCNFDYGVEIKPFINGVAVDLLLDYQYFLPLEQNQSGLIPFLYCGCGDAGCAGFDYRYPYFTTDKYLIMKFDEIHHPNTRYNDEYFVEQDPILGLINKNHLKVDFNKYHLAKNGLCSVYVLFSLQEILESITKALYSLEDFFNQNKEKRIKFLNYPELQLQFHTIDLEILDQAVKSLIEDDTISLEKSNKYKEQNNCNSLLNEVTKPLIVNPFNSWRGYASHLYSPSAEFLRKVKKASKKERKQLKDVQFKIIHHFSNKYRYIEEYEKVDHNSYYRSLINRFCYLKPNFKKLFKVD